MAGLLYIVFAFKNIPILETDRTFSTNPFGETKLAVEKALKWADNAYGIKYVSLRYFNAAGLISAEPSERITNRKAT